MSAVRPSNGPPRSSGRTAQAPRDLSQLRARRRLAQRRRRLLRIDLGLGVLAAIAILALTPGLAIAAFVALLLVVLCVVSLVLERRRARRAQPHGRRPSGGPGR